jgi:hypothetical protein
MDLILTTAVTLFIVLDPFGNVAGDDFHPNVSQWSCRISTSPLRLSL